MKVVSLHVGLNSGLPKTQVERIELLEGYGALGDRHAGKNPQRALLIAGLDSYLRAQQGGIALPYGALGENLLVDQDPHLLEVGTILTHNKVQLRLGAVCTVCSSLSQFGLNLPKLLLEQRGRYAEVLVGGTLEIGQSIEILNLRA